MGGVAALWAGLALGVEGLAHLEAGGGGDVVAAKAKAEADLMTRALVLLREGKPARLVALTPRPPGKTDRAQRLRCCW